MFNLLGKTPYVLRHPFQLIVIIMSNPTNEVKGRLAQFDKLNLALRKTIAKQQKELDAIMTARRTRPIPAVLSKSIYAPV